MTTRPEYTEHAEQLRRVLRLLPRKSGRHDRRSRRALEVALGVLDAGGTPEEAQAAADSSLSRGLHLVSMGTAASS
jgi:hypothetical protein